MQEVYNCQGTHKKLRIVHEFELYKFELDKSDCSRITVGHFYLQYQKQELSIATLDVIWQNLTYIKILNDIYPTITFDLQIRHTRELSSSTWKVLNNIPRQIFKLKYSNVIISWCPSSLRYVAYHSNVKHFLKGAIHGQRPNLQSTSSYLVIAAHKIHDIWQATSNAGVCQDRFTYSGLEKC